MKIVADAIISLNKGTLSQLVERFTAAGCHIKKIDAFKMEKNKEAYRFELIYEEQESFNTCVENLKAYTEAFTLLELNNVLEDSLRGGLLDINCKLPFNSKDDYDVNILGGAALIVGKIQEGKANEFSGISNLVANVCAIKGKGQDKLHVFHTEAERDSIVMKKFFGINCVPLSFRYEQPETCLKHLENSSVGYCAMRIVQIEGGTLSLFSQLADGFPIPVLIRELDELPLYVLSLLAKCSARHRVSTGDTNIGIIGIDNTGVRLTELLLKLGFKRVLGYNGETDILMQFEKQGGLATVKENILGNVDILILMKSVLEENDFESLRPGQYVVSPEQLPAEDMKRFKENGVRDVIDGRQRDLSMFAPGLMRGMIQSGCKTISDDLLIKLSKRGAKLFSDTYRIGVEPESFVEAIAEEFTGE